MLLYSPKENRNHWLNKPSSCKSMGCYTDDQRSCSVRMSVSSCKVQLDDGFRDESKEAFFSAVASCSFLLQGVLALGGQPGPQSNLGSCRRVGHSVRTPLIKAEGSRAGGERAGNDQAQDPGRLRKRSKWKIHQQMRYGD